MPLLCCQKIKKQSYPSKIEQTTFLHLNTEVQHGLLRNIFQYLEPYELIKTIPLVNKHFYEVSNSNHLWSFFLKKTFQIEKKASFKFIFTQNVFLHKQKYQNYKSHFRLRKFEQLERMASFSFISTFIGSFFYLTQPAQCQDFDNRVYTLLSAPKCLQYYPQTHLDYAYNISMVFLFSCISRFTSQKLAHFIHETGNLVIYYDSWKLKKDQ